MPRLHVFLEQFLLSVPLFLLVLLGYLLVSVGKWPKTVSDGMTRFVFGLALPAMLFRLMSDFSDLPAVDARLLIAFFGGAILVFALSRLIGWRVFGLDGAGQSVFAMGTVFSNNVLLGIPIAKAALGDAALPSVSLVLVFNALILWTLMTVSIEWARHGRLSVAGVGATLKGVLTNPLILAILGGTLFGMTGLELPEVVDAPLRMVGASAVPIALVALGMGLAEHSIRSEWKLSITIAAIKLVVLPLVVWSLAWLLGLPAMETRVVVVLSSMATGINVYLMSRQFDTLQGATASNLVLSTALAALTTPLFLALLGI